MKTIFDIHGHFEPLLCNFGPIVLAGGSVRDHLLGQKAKDFDVFILFGSEWTEFREAKKVVEPMLEDFKRFESPVEWHNSEPFLVATLEWNGVVVQIMASPERDLESLISTFDWNVSMFGYDGKRIIGDVSKIGANKELELNAVTFPVSTLRRGFRFSERFLMKFRQEDILSLCAEITNDSMEIDEEQIEED